MRPNRGGSLGFSWGKRRWTCRKASERDARGSSRAGGGFFLRERGMIVVFIDIVGVRGR